MFSKIQPADPVALAVAAKMKGVLTRMFPAQEVLDGVPRVSDLLSDTETSPSEYLSWVGYECQIRWTQAILESRPGRWVVDAPVVLDLGDGLKVQCHPDLVSYERGELWEIKCVHPQRYAYARVQPFKAHISQVQAYLEATGVPVGYLLYEDRGSGEHSIYSISPNPEIRNFLRNLLTRPKDDANGGEGGDGDERGA